MTGTRGGRVTALPSARELRAGLHDSQLLVRLRWRLVRSGWSRLGMALSLFALGVVVLLASNTGALVRLLAEGGRSTAASSLAVDYVAALDRGEIGGMVATTLGAAVAISLLAPFSGSAMHALVDVDDLTGIRPSRMHRYFDSLVTTAVSSIGALQLVALTAVASLLVLDGARSAALVVTWGTWPVLTLLTTAQGWTVELAHRSLGTTGRRGVSLVVLGILGGALWLDPAHGRTLFGLGDAFAGVLRAASRGDWPSVATGCAVILILMMVLAATGLICCRAALARPVATPVATKRSRTLFPLSGIAGVAVLQMLLAHVWRTPQVRRPLLTTLAVCVFACILTGGGTTAMTVVVVAAPLSVALAFGVNVFGVLGPGMVWLAAQPHTMRRLLALAMIFQVVVTLTLAFTIWVPAALVLGSGLSGAVALAIGLAVSIAVSTAMSAASAVRDPHAARLGSRNDMVVPPVTAVRHTLSISLIAGLPAVLALHLDGAAQAVLVAAVLVWASVRGGSVLTAWRDPAVRAFVTFRVAT